MPTAREREYYAMGFQDGFKQSAETGSTIMYRDLAEPRSLPGKLKVKHKKRKLSAWNKFVKANSKKPRFRFANGKLKLKKMGVAFRRTPAGRKKK